MYKIKFIKNTDLMKYFKPKEVLGYCKKCPNFGRIWSCPPHNFNIKKYTAKFKYACIICLKIEVGHLNSQTEISDHFHSERRKFNTKMLSLETKLMGSEVLFSGECHFCKPCSRINNQSCINKIKLRYSLESLGFKVSDICENILDEKLEWINSKKTYCLRSIGAILNHSELSICEIKKLLNQEEKYEKT